jgi:hypothetical protein
LYFGSGSSLRRAITKSAIPATSDPAPTIPGSEFLCALSLLPFAVCGLIALTDAIERDAGPVKTAEWH